MRAGKWRLGGGARNKVHVRGRCGVFNAQGCGVGEARKKVHMWVCPSIEAGGCAGLTVAVLV